MKMPRPRKHRFIIGMPPVKGFVPLGVPGRDLESIILSHEEYEAIRLSDFLGLSQEDGSQKMGTSRATFGRIIASARGKVAKAFVEGKALLIESDSLCEIDDSLHSRRCCRHQHGKGFRGEGRRGGRGGHGCREHGMDDSE